MANYSVKMINNTNEPWYFFMYQTPSTEQKATITTSKITPISASATTSTINMTSAISAISAIPTKAGKSSKSRTATETKLDENCKKSLGNTKRSKSKILSKAADIATASGIHSLVWIVSKYRMSAQSEYTFFWQEDSEFFWCNQSTIKPGLRIVPKTICKAPQTTQELNSTITFSVINNVPAFSLPGTGIHSGSLVINVKAGVPAETYLVGTCMNERITMVGTAIEKAQLIFTPTYWIGASRHAPRAGTIISLNSDYPVMPVSFPFLGYSAAYELTHQGNKEPAWQAVT